MYRGELFIGAPCRCSLLWLGYICFCDVLHFLVNSAVVGLGLAVLDKDHLVVARKRPSHLQMDSLYCGFFFCVCLLRSRPTLAGRQRRLVLAYASGLHQQFYQASPAGGQLP